MIFLPSVESLLREAYKDPVFQDLVSAFAKRDTHINLTSMTETQKAYLIAAAVLWKSENDSKYTSSEKKGKEADSCPIPMILVSDELSARKMKSYLDAFFEKELRYRLRAERSSRDVSMRSLSISRETAVP